MTIKEFNPTAGRYAFSTCDLTADFHAHPVLEIVTATNGKFTICGKNGIKTETNGVCIKANATHALHVENVCTEIFMSENSREIWTQLAAFLPANAEENFLFFDEKEAVEVQNILTTTGNSPYQNTDSRVKNTIDFLHTLPENSALTLKHLASRVHLSPGRLSHLFKQEIGCSVQKYIPWVRMKGAIEMVLQEQISFTDAALEVGFYDSAHFSRHFKELFGVSASTAYK